jgi:dihydropteroate synthase
MSALVWHVRGRDLSLDRPLVMGVLNVTPDSFSDGGEHFTPESAAVHADRLLSEGADIVDVGGESTRPQGARPVAPEEELRRVIPVIRALALRHPSATISVDTVKVDVARAALEAGAHIVNDVSGFRLDGSMATVCATFGAGVVVMHSRGGVADMATNEHAEYGASFFDEMLSELRERVDAVQRAGVSRDRIAVDPGIGFAKRPEHSLRALACLRELAAWGYPVVVGASGRVTSGAPRLRLRGRGGRRV